MTTIEKGSIVLVTGVNGYIASHVADQFLSSGYRVRGTVRSESKGKWIQEMFDKKYGAGKFEVQIVEDMQKKGAFDDAVKGVSGIAHVASILTFSSDPQEVIPPTVSSATAILTSALSSSSVKSFVYTSSSTAASMPSPDAPLTITKSSWNDAAVEKAWAKDPKPNGFTVYAASKTEAERAIWKFVEEKKPGFQVSCVLPSANMGEIFSSEQPASTGAWVPSLYKGKLDGLIDVPQYFINVKDTARLHVAGLTDPSQNGQRIFAFTSPYNFNDILAVIRKLHPDHKVIDDIPGLGRDLTVVPNGDAEELLKKHFGEGFVGLEETVVENLKGVV